MKKAEMIASIHAIIRTGSVKIFLNVSKDEQRKRLAERLINPDKHYKFDLADIRERQSVSFKEVAR